MTAESEFVLSSSREWRDKGGGRDLRVHTLAAGPTFRFPAWCPGTTQTMSRDQQDSCDPHLPPPLRKPAPASPMSPMPGLGRSS